MFGTIGESVTGFSHQVKVYVGEILCIEAGKVCLQGEFYVGVLPLVKVVVDPGIIYRV